ncbi:hypothetical protein [Devosia salina]|uniref:Uncharacterized protein n=1 Tax=Devosia salina TaxID=2860336 RepID=A0ABX8WD44_9HYPH|nr:hypothetical protein [Devosia salina]QYO75901.1 hypothetical protein K1X15_14885 [Devosia salina]
MKKNGQESTTLAEAMEKNRQQPKIKSAWGQFCAEIVIYAMALSIYYFWMTGLDDSIYKRNVEIILVIGVPIFLIKLVHRLQKDRPGSR